MLRGEFPDLRWLAVGDGIERASLSALAETLGLSGAVVWAGLRTDVHDLLAAMDVWVMSSVREGLPVALLEAMASQKPIVATRVGGIPDAVRGGSEAILVPPSDPEALARAVAEMLREPGRAEAMAAAARQRAVSEYGIDRVARRIEEVYLQELGKLSEDVDRP
jgi:glycosyltransferase involved in cell wall biosynthesis